MERVDIGKGRYVIQMSQEEIRELNDQTKQLIELTVKASEILQKKGATDNN